MKAVFLSTPETLELRDVPARREAEAHEVLLEPLVVGLGGNDVLHYRQGAPVQDGFRRPMISGSEFVARVVAIGRGVDPTLLHRRVVASPVSPCQRCEWCTEGNQHLCPNSRTLGVPPTAGAMQQRFSWPATLCVRVAEKVPNHQAVLLVPLSLAIHIADHANIPIMGSVAVLGCGHLGLLLIKTLRATGVGTILAVDGVPYRREAALQAGATHAVDPTAAEDLARTLPRSGADVAIDVTNSSAGSRTAVSLTKIGGRVILAGIPDDNRIFFSALEARRRELVIHFVNRPHNTLRRAEAFLESGALGDLDWMVTHRFPLDQVADAFRLIRRMKDGVIKCLVEMPAYEPAEESPDSVARAAAVQLTAPA